jgi:hydroxypyruvate isomerase
MPRFSANLSFLFNETPFLERFGEAAHAGFRAVEFAFPYDFQAKEIAAHVLEHKLEVVLFNTPPGDHAAGDRGVASIPGREHEFAAGIVTCAPIRASAALSTPARNGRRASGRLRRRRTHTSRADLHA